MSSYLRKAVCLGADSIFGPPYNSEDYRVARPYFGPTAEGGTDTPWVRLWAWWPSLQASAGETLGQNPKWAQLDAQIQAANQAGTSVLLCAFGCPEWAALLPNSSAPTANRHNKCVPAVTGTNGPWGRFLGHLMDRYGPQSAWRAGTVDILEVCNEPNYEMWPQKDANGSRTMHCAIADMMMSAKALRDSKGWNTPMLLGPATADVAGTNATQVDYLTFTQDLISVLNASQFAPGSAFGWSHHNYNDVERDLGPNSTGPSGTGYEDRLKNRATSVRDAIAGKWAGFPYGSSASSEVFLTEGGARLPKIQTYYGTGGNTTYYGTATYLRNKQSDLLNRALARLSSDGPNGARIGMFTWFLFVSDRNYDCGLRNSEFDDPMMHDVDTPFHPALAARPAYTRWSTMPPVR